MKASEHQILQTKRSIAVEIKLQELSNESSIKRSFSDRKRDVIPRVIVSHLVYSKMSNVNHLSKT